MMVVFIGALCVCHARIHKQQFVSALYQIRKNWVFFLPIGSIVTKPVLIGLIVKLLISVPPVARLAISNMR